MKRKGIIGVLSVATLALAGLALLPSTPTFAATTSSSNVTVRLTVLPSGESVVIRFPSDGDTFAIDKITIKKDYTSARTLETKIIYTDENGITTTYNVPVENVADPHGNPTNGTSESELDITAITGGRYGDYKIITTVNGLPSTEDVINFSYRAVKITDNGTDPSTNNPKVNIEHGPRVDHITVQIYDENGNPVLPNPITIPTPDTTGGHGGITPWTVPLDGLNLKDGKYQIVTTAYDNGGNILDRNTKYWVKYTSKKTPSVPETGGSVFAGTNFTSADFISTSLAIFFVATFFAIMVLKRNRKSQRRS